MMLLSRFARLREEDLRGEVYWGKSPDQPGLPLKGGKVRGWAYDTRRDAPLAVELRIDGAVVSRSRGGVAREGIDDPHEARSGFGLDVPESARGGGLRHYRICAAGTDILVPNGEFLAALDEEGELLKLDRAEGSPGHRLLLPWHRPSRVGGELSEAKRLVAAGRAGEACDYLRDLYNAEPSSRTLLERLARVCITAARPDEALAAVDCLLALDPGDLGALERRVRVLVELGKTGELAASLDALEEANPGGSAPALERVAQTCARDRREEASLVALNCLLERDGGNVVALELRIDVLLALGQTDALPETLDALAGAAPHTRKLALGWIRYHVSHEDLRAALEWAVWDLLAIDDDPKQAMAALTQVLDFCDRLTDPEAAAGHAAAAVAAFPANASFRRVEGDRLLALGRIEKAEASYEAALEIDRKHVPSHVRLGQACFLLRRFGEAFDRMEWRLSDPGRREEDGPVPQLSRWSGDLDLPGALLVWAENGVEIPEILLQLALVPALTDRLGVSVVLVVPPPLVKIARLSFPAVRVASTESLARPDPEGVRITHQVPLGSLARLFRRRSEDFAFFHPYFAADKERRRGIRDELVGDGRRRLVGLAATNDGVTEGAPSLEDFVRVLDSPDVRFVVLEGVEDPGALGRAQALATNDVVLGEGIAGGELEGLATLVGAMDLVVASPGMAAHLAGGLGVPSLVFARPLPSAWWLGAGGDCAWYPHTTVVRRSALEAGWEGALAKARKWLTSPDAARTAHGSTSQVGKADELETYLDHLLDIALADRRGATAAPIIARLLERRTGDPDLLMKQGETALSINDPETAKTAFRALLELDHDGARARTGLTQALVARYELSEAAFLLDSFVDEAEPELRRLHAALLLETGSPERAAAQCELLLSADDLGPEARLDVEILLARALCGLGKHTAALDRLEPLAKGENVEPRAWLERGNILNALGDLDGAAAAYAVARGSGDGPIAATFLALCRKDPAYIGEPAAARGVAIPALRGDLPAAAQDDLVLFVSCDAGYWRLHAATLLASVAQNAPDAFVHVHVVNPDEDCRRHLAIFGQVLGARRLSATFETVDLSGVAETYPLVYYSSIRFARLYQIAERRPTNYLCVDADCLVRAPLAGLLRQAGSGDVALLRRFGRSLETSVAAGGLFARPTAGARVFLRDVAAGIFSVLTSGEAEWFLDQVVISSAVERGCRSGTVAVAQLDYAYIDWCFRKDGIVWTGKGDRKFSNDSYVLEKSFYAARADHERLVQGL